MDNKSIMEYQKKFITNETLRIALDFSYCGLYIVNKDLDIVYINNTASEILNIPLDAVMNHKTTDYFSISYLKDIIEKDESCVDLLAVRNNVEIIISRYPLHNDFGNTIGALAIFQSISALQNSELKVRKRISKTALEAKYTFDNIICQSLAMKQLINQAKKYAKTASTVIITGESGTGKELFAQSIHNYSDRKEQPFVAINCAALPESILESELFGYAEASFTGAKKGGKSGLFQQAHMGTLFLDEIGELPLNLQSKLLRVLQEKQVRPIGSDKIIPLDVRILAATNKNLRTEVENGNFRLDLMYRLNVLNLYIPPLRSRPEDIYALVLHFLSKFRTDIYSINKDVIRTLISHLETYSFPGNVRELENIVERLALLLSDKDSETNIDSIITQITDPYFVPYQEQKNTPLKTIIELDERRKIEDALLQCGGNKSKAAELLNMSTATFWRKVNKYKIEV